MTVGYYLIAGLALALLMVVHEGGHYLAARHFGMRVVKFSIGFGPTIYKHQPAGSPTVYQVAIIPFLAYVQIAGMNPYEPVEAGDNGSYANATLTARATTIAAGPFANYLFASVLLFFGFVFGGRTVSNEASMRVTVADNGPAHAAQMHDGDKIVAVNGEGISNWDDLKHAVSRHPGEPVDILIEREGTPLHLPVTPGAKGDKGEGKIMIGPEYVVAKVSPLAALGMSLVEPPKIVIGLVKGLASMLLGKEKAELSGPVGIVRETAGAVRSGVGDAFKFLGALSAYLGGFNLLPVPALDGGRLLFLGMEVVSRRKPNAKVEARVHAVGLLMMLTLIAFVTYTEILPKH